TELQALVSGPLLALRLCREHARETHQGMCTSNASSDAKLNSINTAESLLPMPDATLFSASIPGKGLLKRVTFVRLSESYARRLSRSLSV
ncbi:MAG: hypothetical protein ACI8QC_000734, partial [Planctomycetota bacterium]